MKPKTALHLIDGSTIKTMWPIERIARQGGPMLNVNVLNGHGQEKVGHVPVTAIVWIEDLS